MPFRFFRRKTILPGVRLNFSKHGISTSFGGRGAWLTVGPQGTRTTVGIPSSGLYYTTTSGRSWQRPAASASDVAVANAASERLAPSQPLAWRIVASLAHVLLFVAYAVLWLAVHLLWWAIVVVGAVAIGVLLGSLPPSPVATAAAESVGQAPRTALVGSARAT